MQERYSGEVTPSSTIRNSLSKLLPGKVNKDDILLVHPAVNISMGWRTVPGAEDLESSRILLSDAAKAAWEYTQLLDQVFNPFSHRKFQLAPGHEPTWHEVKDLSVHCKDAIPKIRNKYSRKETARPRSHFLHSWFDDRFIYSHDPSAYSAAAK